jgi:predicted metalloprotease with PDZ domain
MAPIEFVIDATRPESGHLAVTATFGVGAKGIRAQEAGSEGRLVLFLPVWTPGSYLVREFARHLNRPAARDAATGQALPVEKIGKNRFAIALDPATERVAVDYTVYAHELSVRTADLSDAHAYWNNACVLMWPVGAETRPANLTIRHRADWQFACALEETAPARVTGAVTERRLCAADADAIYDAPVLIGALERHEWLVDDVPHTLVLDGLAGVRPKASLVDDLAAIVHEAKAVFGALPYDQYLFQALFTTDAHGGLEHANSTTLLMGRAALTSDRGYEDFLTLAAHELFHAWNVKRMRPRELWRYDYERENHTSMLWLIEGWTAYYDDLLVRRCRRMPRRNYLARAAKNVQQLRQTPGRLRLSLAESSHDAWIRLYRPDENTRNSSQNYYVNGAVAAMCLDLTIRQRSDGARSLDQVVRLLYERTFAAGRGYDRGDVDAAVRDVGGDEAVDLLQGLVDGPLDPDLGPLLRSHGLELIAQDAGAPHLGITFATGGTTIASVAAGGAAATAGLMAGDELLALGGLRVDNHTWQDVFQARARVGEPLPVLLARRGVVIERTAMPEAGLGTLVIQPAASATDAERALGDAWLGSDAAVKTGLPAPDHNDPCVPSQ